MLKRLTSLVLVFIFLSVTVALTIAEQWQSIPMTTKEMKDNGVVGGEGGQWGNYFAVDPVDGKTVLYGTDVGGMYRSTDGGNTWVHSNTGLGSRGVICFAFDPVNSNRVFAIGSNNVVSDQNGVYLSTNKGSTWNEVFPWKINLQHDWREQIIVDPGSYSDTQKMCMTLYWSTPQIKNDTTGRLFKSTDGGIKWSEVANSTSIGLSILKIHPAGGILYAGNSNGKLF